MNDVSAIDLAREVYRNGPDTIAVNYYLDGTAELINGDRRLVIGDELTRKSMGDATDGDQWGWIWTTYERNTTPENPYPEWEEMMQYCRVVANVDEARKELSDWANS